MEDSHIAVTNLSNGVSVFGVFDGHGGQEVALYVKKHYIKLLTALPSFKSKNYRLALEESFFKIDEQMLTDAGMKELTKLAKSSGDDPYNPAQLMGSGRSMAGCTATVALITQQEIYCANSGDSRTVLSKGKKAVDLSVDHKPNDPEEKRRIIAGNGFVEDNRVNGMLALSRAMGDFEYKNNTMMKAKD